MVYKSTTVSQQRKQKIKFLALRKEKRYQYVKYLSSLILCEILEFYVNTSSSSMLLILSWKLTIIACRGKSTIPPSSKLELLCQYEMTFVFTKIDDR